MKCTECSREIKPVVAVDIDGTLGNYHAHLERFIRQYLQWPGPVDVKPYDGSIPYKVWVQETFLISVEEFRTIKLAYRQGAQKRSMPPFPGAGEFCRSIKAQGAELWLTTTRPYLRLDNVDPDTRFWLRRQGIEYDGLLYDEDKYRVLHEIIGEDRVVAVVDDLDEMIESAGQVFGEHVPIKRYNGYNNWDSFGKEEDDLMAIGHIVSKRIVDWKEEHGQEV